MDGRDRDRPIKITEKGAGNYLKMQRKAKGCQQKEICDGICSAATLSRIEAGELIVDFLVIEALLSRLKLDRMEYEFVLDEEDYRAYKRREEIEIQVKNHAWGQAEKRIAAYEKQYGTGELHGQFLYFQRALLERAKSCPDRNKSGELFLKALTVTAPEYQKKLKGKEILSNLELRCISEIIYCMEESTGQENEYRKLYDYFVWSSEREGFFPSSYRTAMQYFGECLYKNGKCEECIQICDEALQELTRTSKVENRAWIFLLRAKAREGSVKTEEQKRQCLKDYLTAYHILSFYEETEKSGALRAFIGENYGWEFLAE